MGQIGFSSILGGSEQRTAYVWLARRCESSGLFAQDRIRKLTTLGSFSLVNHLETGISRGCDRRYKLSCAVSIFNV